MGGASLIWGAMLQRFARGLIACSGYKERSDIVPVILTIGESATAWRNVLLLSYAATLGSILTVSSLEPQAQGSKGWATYRVVETPLQQDGFCGNPHAYIGYVSLAGAEATSQ